MRYRDVVPFVLLVAACHTEARTDGFAWRADLPPSTYFPLEAGTAWSYDVTEPPRRDVLLLINRVLVRDGNRAIFAVEPEPLSYVDAGDRITMEPAGKTMIKAPLTVGTEWPITGGRAVIRAIDRHVVTRTGDYAACLVVEERSAAGRVVTSYAPHVGPVLLEIYAGDLPSLVPGGPSTELLIRRAELRGFHAGAPQAP